MIDTIGKAGNLVILFITSSLAVLHTKKPLVLSILASAYWGTCLNSFVVGSGNHDPKPSAVVASVSSLVHESD